MNEIQFFTVVRCALCGVDSLGYDGVGWDKAQGLLPCANGVIDLETGKLRKGRQRDFIKCASPVAFDASAACPTWEHFLLEVMGGDENLVAYLRRLLGYAITGFVREHKLPILYGQGRNGKGTMIEVLHDVLGGLSAPVRSELLLEQSKTSSAAAPSSDIMALRGRRLVWASETAQGRKFDGSRVKWLVGGDTMTGRPPYGKLEISFKPCHTLLLLTNYRPQADATDYAFWERVHLIPFNTSFVDSPEKSNEKKRDAMLPSKLAAERPGILRWLVSGAREYLRDGLCPPDVVLDATKEYRDTEDVIQDFINERCEIIRGEITRASDLFSHFRRWADEGKITRIGSRTFGERAKKKLQHGKDENGIYYVGLRIKKEEWEK